MIIKNKNNHSFVIAGCARSGTGYISEVLSNCGISCGHESIINPNSIAKDNFNFGIKTGDSSWFSVPFLELLREKNIKIFHQIRNPLNVIRSHVGRNLMSDTRKANSSTHPIIYKFNKTILEKPNQTTRTIRYWVEWNEFAKENAVFTYRIEDICVDLILKISSYLEIDIDENKVKKSLEKVPKNYNTRKFKSSFKVNWNSIPSDEYNDKFIKMSEKYNYKIV